MNMSSFLTKALPHIIAVVIFLAISIFMYRPIIFEGKVMDQNDINQGKGAAKELVDYRNSTGEQALWTNSMFSGMPTYLTGLQWSGATILNTIQKILLLNLPRPVGENFLAFLAFYIMLLIFGVRPNFAIVGALAFGLSTFFVVSIQAGHMWKIRAIAYMPLVIGGIKLVFDKKYINGLVVTAFALALEINANHPQITYYLFILLLIYGITEIIDHFIDKKYSELLKMIGVLLIAGILAIGTNFGKLWATYEYGNYSIRGKSELSSPTGKNTSGLDEDYVFRWSNGKWESLTMFIPHLYGGASGVYNGTDSELERILKRNNVNNNEIGYIQKVYLGYWGDQPGTAGPVYVGSVVISLFVLSLLVLDKKTKYWMLSVVILSVVLSWGKNFIEFNRIVYEHFPGYNKFRAVTMVIILALTLIPTMGILGLQKIVDQGLTKELQKKILIAVSICIGIALIALLFTNPPTVEGIQKIIGDAINRDRKSIIRSDVFRSVLFSLLALGAIYLYLKNTISQRILAIIIGLLVLFDLGFVNARYLNDGVFRKKANNSFINITPADEIIQSDTTLSFRVLNLQDPFNEARTSYFHKSIGGYHGAKIRRYQDLISSQIVPEMQQIIKDKKITQENSRVISMLNTKYLLSGLQSNSVIQNNHAIGNAWFVQQVKEVQNADEEIKMIGEVDLKNVAVIDTEKFKFEPPEYDSASTIRMVLYEPDRLVYKSSSATPSLVVFSEIYYPIGWKASVDGVEVPIIRADYILRALNVPPGEHEIEFTFKPKSYYVGNKVMMTSSIFLLVLGMGGIIYYVKSSRSKSTD